MKRISKLLITLSLCLVMLWPQVAEAAPSASLDGTSSIQAGSDVTLTLKVSGSNIMGVEATLNYDSSVLVPQLQRSAQWLGRGAQRHEVRYVRRG